jgi:hypothetical protein
MKTGRCDECERTVPAWRLRTGEIGGGVCLVKGDAVCDICAERIAAKAMADYDVDTAYERARANGWSD